MIKTKTKNYTTSELARIFGVSVSAISTLILKLKLKPVKTGKHNRKYYDTAVYKVLEEHYKSSRNKVKSEVKSTTKDQLIEEQRERIADLQKQIEFLQAQIEVKDEQIKLASQLADQAQKLDLTTHRQQIEAPDLIKTEVKAEEEPKKSFFGKLFGK